MESFPHHHGGRKGPHLPEWRTRGGQHHPRKLLGTRQTDLPFRTDRTAEPQQSAPVQKHLPSGTMITRRSFIGSLAALSVTGAYARKLAANDKLNIGVIGVAGRGGENLNGVASQNIVALCDVDDRNLAKAAAKFPSAKTYSDFRHLIDQKDI